jgi:hypothetical protein
VRIWTVAAVAGCLAGVAIPAIPGFFAVPARSAPADVRLVTSIATTARKARGAEELIDFTVTVRSIGGGAQGVGVDAGIEPAGTWVAPPGGCRTRDHGARLRCELGDVSGRKDLDLAARLPASTGPSAPPVLVTVTTTSSAMAESTTEPQAAGSSASASASMAPSAVPFTAPSKVPRSSASAPCPAAPPSVVPRPVAPRPAGSRPATAHQTGPSRRPRRPHPVPRAAVPRPAVPSIPAIPVPAAPPTAPGPSVPGPSVPGPSVPGPSVPGPSAPALAPMPSLPGEPPAASGDAAGPGAVRPAPSSSPPDLSLVLPDLAGPAPSGAASPSGEDPASIDPPQMSIVRADPVAGSRRAWVTVLAITIVFETAVLWLAACLSLWRRRAALTRAASSGLTGWWPRSVRRALAVLRR